MFTYDDEFKHIAKYMDIYELLPVQMKGVSKRKTSADNKIKLLRELNNRED